MTVAERQAPAKRRVRTNRSTVGSGITDEELDAIRDRLAGREPNELELAMFSVMWSEHCSYKSIEAAAARRSRPRGEGVVAGPGENAGVISIGDGLAVAFKIESHNHPSAVEPYQGAATGVGGILRDIFTMGARPIAILDALRFGDPSDARTRHLVDGVVAGRRRIRQLRRHPDGRRRARLRPDVPGQPAGQRDGGRVSSRSATSPVPPPRDPATSSSCSGRPPAATASVARRSSRAPRSATGMRRSDPRCRSATRSPRSC